MKQVRSISYNDASMYFNGVLALRKEDGQVCEINPVTLDFLTDRRDIAGRCRRPDGDWERRNWYAALSETPGTRASSVILPETLAEEYILSKFPLGWLNFDSGALYLTSNSERSVRKGHRRDRIFVKSVYHDALGEEYNALSVKYEQARGAGKEQERLRLVEKLDTIHAALRQHQPTNRNITHYLQNVHGTVGNPTYPPLEEVQQIMLTEKPERHSVALSREFAACLCNEFHTTTVGLFFHMKLIGFIDAKGVHVFRAFSGMLPHLNRTLHVRGEVS